MQLQQRSPCMPVQSKWIRKTELTQLHWRWKGTVPFVKGLKTGRSLRDLWLSCCPQVKRNVCGQPAKLADAFLKDYTPIFIVRSRGGP
jgi:hypothetical protein